MNRQYLPIVGLAAILCNTPGNMAYAQTSQITNSIQDSNSTIPVSQFVGFIKGLEGKLQSSTVGEFTLTPSFRDKDISINITGKQDSYTLSIQSDYYVELIHQDYSTKSNSDVMGTKTTYSADIGRNLYQVHNSFILNPKLPTSVPEQPQNRKPTENDYKDFGAKLDNFTKIINGIVANQSKPQKK